MSPRDFLLLAAEMGGRGTAAASRSAISRAYYAAYCSAVERLAGIVPVSRGPGAHGEVARCLANSGDARLTGCARQLAALHHKRIRADYRLDMADVEDPEVAIMAVSEARALLRTLDEAFTGDRGRIVESIRTYWTSVLRKPL